MRRFTRWLSIRFSTLVEVSAAARERTVYSQRLSQALRWRLPSTLQQEDLLEVIILASDVSLEERHTRW